MENEKKTAMAAEQADISPVSGTTEPAPMTTTSKKDAKRSKKRKTRVFDDLLSSLLLLLLLCLAGVLNFLINQNYQSGVISNNLSYYLIYALCIPIGIGIFFATRTGDGKNVYRVNWFSILFVIIPVTLLALGYVLANEQIISSGFYYDVVNWILQNVNSVLHFGLIVMGYAIPYSFISGFERRVEDAPAVITETTTVEAVEPTETDTPRSDEVAEASETVEPAAADSVATVDEAPAESVDTPSE